MSRITTASEEKAPSSFRSALPALLFLASIFFLNFTARIIFSPLLPVISGELGLHHADSGALFLCISSGYVVAILLSGYVSAKISHRRTIVLSSAACGLMLLLVSVCMSTATLRIGLMGLGLAAGLYLPSGLITISGLVPPAYRARGMAVHELAPNLSFVVTPLVCVAGLTLLSWRMEVAVLGVLMLGMGILAQLFGSNSQGAGTAPSIATLKQIIRLPRFWLISVMFSMAICSTLGIYAMLPLYLVSERGMNVESANTLVALSRIGSVVMPLLAGWLGDRWGNHVVMGAVLLFAGLLTVPIGCTDGWFLVCLVILQPMAAVCFFPSAFAELSNVGPKGAKNVAVSLCIPLAFLSGGGILPAMIGTIGDHYSLAAGIMAAGGLMVMASACSLRLRNSSIPHPV